MNNVKVGHCSLFSCAKGYLYVTLRMQELPMMISSDNDHDIEGDDTENCKSETNEDHNNLKDNCPIGSSGEKQVKRFIVFFFFNESFIFPYRGICYFFVEVTCASKDLHSGVFGGTV